MTVGEDVCFEGGGWEGDGEGGRVGRVRGRVGKVRGRGGEDEGVGGEGEGVEEGRGGWKMVGERENRTRNVALLFPLIFVVPHRLF